ncbi:MAG: methyltransferase family protein [Nevskiales bacterium]
MHPGIAIFSLWVLWGSSWMAAAWWSNTTEKRPGLGAEVGYRIVQMLGIVLFLIPAHGYEGVLRLWHIGWTGAWICVVLAALGFAFCWWARIHLGRLWSGMVTRKADHKVIDTGPYALVRHPIYTGILLAVFATMAAKGTVLGIAGTLLIVIGIWMKARLEERWLSQELGAGAYEEYRRRVPMLLPFGPKGA